MADVVTKCIAGNDVDNGVVTILIGGGHTHQTNTNRETPKDPDLSLVEARLANKFDEITYYSN